MKYKSLFSLALMLVVTGCNSTVSDRPVAQPATQATPSVSQPIKPSLSAEAPPASSPTAGLPPQRQPADPSTATPLKPKEAHTEAPGDNVGSNTTQEIKRDYAPTTPIAATGKVTIRDRIRAVDTNQLITECPADTAPYALAESTHYRIQICSEEYDPQLPKYYIGQAKDGSGELRITSKNVDEARQLIFKNNDYTYILYRDGARPEQINAYLEVYEPNGKGYAEALLYLYE